MTLGLWRYISVLVLRVLRDLPGTALEKSAGRDGFGTLRACEVKTKLHARECYGPLSKLAA